MDDIYNQVRELMKAGYGESEIARRLQLSRGKISPHYRRALLPKEIREHEGLTYEVINILYFKRSQDLKQGDRKFPAMYTAWKEYLEGNLESRYGIYFPPIFKKLEAAIQNPRMKKFISDLRHGEINYILLKELDK